MNKKFAAFRKGRIFSTMRAQANPIMRPDMNRLLFLCTGNYYRSRFAEILFNSLASRYRLDWQADSRGLALDLTGGNVGPMANVACESLVMKGIRCTSMQRFPMPVSPADFQTADLIVALDEKEHRPMMRERFPVWENQIVYWLIHDLDLWAAETALPAIESHVNQLANELRENPALAGKAK
ncbi:MAG: low molecular weight phosphatase family protein [Verrucomicrobiota bacterium]